MSSVRRKEPLDKKKMVKIALVTGAVLAVIVILIFVLRNKVSDQFGKDDETEVLTAEVTVGSISTTISGSGTLTNEEANEITIPQTVEVKEIYVNTSDTVKEGDMLASVNSASVVAAMNEIQEELDALDDELSEVAEEEVEDTITSGVAGRVKKIYAKKGKNVADIMYKKQALMLISVDGYMAVDVETDALAKGDSVTVKTSDSTKYTGTVDSVWGGKATVLITDNGTTYGDTVTVSLGDDKTAEGDLYIHECVKVTGYTGTISSVNVSENQSISAGKTLLYLSGTSNSVNYATILEKREALEEQLQNLIVIYKEGAVYAQEAGMVTSITEVEDSTVTTTTANTNSGFSSGNSSTAYVYTSYDESTKEFGDMVEVTIGISNGTYIEITDGLSEGDTVYYQETGSEDERGGFGNMQGGNMPGGDMSMPGGDMSMPGGGNMTMPGGGDMQGGRSGGRSGNSGN